MPSVVRWALGILAVAVAMMLAASLPTPVGAHTGLESSQPAEGDTVSEPVAAVSLTFNRPVEPAGSGLTVFDEHGVERRPDSLSSADSQTWLLEFETPLASGEYEVRWRVAAEDGHIVEGAFSFAVALPDLGPGADQSTDSSEPPVGEPSDHAAAPDADGTHPTAAVTGSAKGDDSESASPNGAAAQAGGQARDASTAPAASVPSPAGTSGQSAAVPPDETSWTWLRSSEAAGAQRIAEIVRILSLLATLCMVGGLAFASFVVRDERAERARALRWAAMGGIVLAVSAVAAAVTQAVVWDDSWSAMWSPDAGADALSTSFGVAVGLRLLGGIAVLAASRQGTPRPGGMRLPTVSLIGAALVIASYVFDGHTVTEGPRWLHASANATHVYAASVWSGGLAMLSGLLWRCRRSGRSGLRSLMRFSQLASASFVLAGVGGTVMAVLILDRFADLWSTAWGRLLLAKIALVAVAAFLGARNRWIHMPVATQRSGQPAESPVSERLLRTVVIEAVLLGCVGVVTAFLVGASAI